MMIRREHDAEQLADALGARPCLTTRLTLLRSGQRWPLYRVDQTGSVHRLAMIEALGRNRYVVKDTRRSRTGLERIHGNFEGIPYYLQDARPAGFLGRAVPTLYPGLGLSEPVGDWSDDQFLVYLTSCAADSVGDLILGEKALEQYVTANGAPPVVPAAERGRMYPELAAAAMAARLPPSSAQGEHPKFIVSVAEGTRQTEMIVKFSAPRTTDVGQRSADLLVAEHHAHATLAANGIPACDSQLVMLGDQVFLEVRRFDRTAAMGRVGAVSLFAVDAARYGRLDSWDACAERLSADGLLSDTDVQLIRFLDLFGALIANNDRHFSNLTLFDPYEGPFQLAPSYDMLPMLFAPRNGKLIERPYEPPRPTADTAFLWPRARVIAEQYWHRLLEEPLLSRGFAKWVDGCRARLRRVTLRWLQ